MSRFGLRSRLTLAFAAGSLLLSAVLSIVTFFLSRNFLLDRRESLARQQALLNARVVSNGLTATDPDISGLLDAVGTATTTSHSLLYRKRQWYSSSVSLGPQQLPQRLEADALAGEPVQQRVAIDGPTYVVGVPLIGRDSVYFEVFSLKELDTTLHVLAAVLLVAATGTTAAGTAVGWWAGRRVLRPLSVVAATATDIAGGHLSRRITASDPDLAEIAASFNHMVEALEQRIARDARFASDVSHELRSPVTALSTSADVLVHRSRDWPPDSREVVDLVVDEIRRFGRLVDDVLEISRAEAATDQESELTVASELVLQAVRRSGRPDVPVDIADAAEPCLVLADRRRLDRVLTNLIDNAERHGGGVTAVRVRRADAHCRIEVEDRGAGVPVEDRDRIFDRFARRAGADRSSGFGLGLSIVAEHIRLHGGRVWVEDNATVTGSAAEGTARGARFVVELPVVHA